MKKLANLLTILLASAAFAAGQPSVRAALQPTAERKVAPAFELQDSAGKKVNLKKFRGKVVLLDFWATWCTGCKQEIPWFAEFHRKYAGKGLQVVGVSLDEEGWKVLRPFLLSANLPYRILLGDEPLAKQYAIENMPDTFLIDRKGRIAAKYVGLVDRENIEENLRVMLAQR
jgi:peroxiredoxin